MITPYLKSQRGNSQTATRLYEGLSRSGYNIDLLSLEEPDWQKTLDQLTHTTEYSLVHGYHALKCARIIHHSLIKKIPLLLTTTGTDINFDLTGPERNQTIAALLSARKVVVFSEDLHKQILAVAPELQSRLVIIRQGVKLSSGPAVTRTELGLSPANAVFILPSGLRPVKNLDLAVDALKSIYPACPQLRLLILGTPIDEKYADHIKNRLQDLEWASYLGELPHQHMRGIMQIADIVLNTSLAEGQPQGALEAMSLGKPSILTAVPGNLGIIQHGCQGYYVSTAAELAEYARQLIQNPLLRQTMGVAARRLVQEKFSPEAEIAAYSRLYQELMVN